ncbi:MAG TPA: hypothetical protein VF906_05880 [Candidatus Bathyarchaeia archaeon]
MIAPELSSLVTEGNIFDPAGLLDIGQAVFAVVLFAVSLYAWYLRKQTSLVIVALAFLMFFVKTVIREFFSQLPGEDFITDSLDFVALALFFLAVVVRPRKDISKGAV